MCHTARLSGGTRARKGEPLTLGVSYGSAVLGQTQYPKLGGVGQADGTCASYGIILISSDAKQGQTTKAKLSKWGRKYKTQLLGGSGEGVANCTGGDNKQLRPSAREGRAFLMKGTVYAKSMRCEKATTL